MAQQRSRTGFTSFGPLAAIATVAMLTAILHPVLPPPCDGLPSPRREHPQPAWQNQQKGQMHTGFPHPLAGGPGFSGKVALLCEQVSGRAMSPWDR